MSFFSDHPWIREDGDAPDTPLDNAVLNRLKQFRAMNKFKKAALRVSFSFSITINFNKKISSSLIISASNCLSVRSIFDIDYL